MDATFKDYGTYEDLKIGLIFPTSVFQMVYQEAPEFLNL